MDENFRKRWEKTNNVPYCDKTNIVFYNSSGYELADSPSNNKVSKKNWVSIYPAFYMFNLIKFTLPVIHHL